MSEHTKYMLMAAAGISLTVLAILLWITSYRRLEEASTGILEKEQQKQTLIDEYALTRYDGSTIYGSQVITYLKTNWNHFQGEVYLDGVQVTDADHFRTLNHAFYINGNGTYLLTLTYNDNKVPYKVTITSIVTP